MGFETRAGFLIRFVLVLCQNDLIICYRIVVFRESLDPFIEIDYSVLFLINEFKNIPTNRKMRELLFAPKRELFKEVLKFHEIHRSFAFYR